MIKRLAALYLIHRNLHKAALAAEAEGLRTRRIRKAGKDGWTGGKVITRGHLCQLLTNPIYAGRIRHKDKVYEGQHPALIDQAEWEGGSATRSLRRRWPQAWRRLKGRECCCPLQ